VAVNSNARQRIPELFLAIMDVDESIEKIRANLVIEFAKIRELKKRKEELKRAAEAALSWNQNKGSPLSR
jgi:hypothetical protein